MMVEQGSNQRVIPFERDFDQSDLAKVTYKKTTTTTTGTPPNTTSTTETEKVDVPIITAGAPKHIILYCINKYYIAHETLDWNGAKLFENIKDILSDSSIETLGIHVLQKLDLPLDLKRHSRNL